MDQTAFINTLLSESTASGRTSPVYVRDKSKMALDEITKPRPAGEKRQIDISWIEKALNLKAFETKYSAWDAINMPSGVWAAAACGRGCIIAVSAGGKAAVTFNAGNEWKEYDIIPDITSIVFGEDKYTNAAGFMAFASSGEAVYSGDNGVSWHKINAPKESWADAAYSGGVYFAVSLSGRLFQSSDFGKSWEEVPLPISVTPFAINTDGKGAIMIIGSGGKSLLSKDNGVTFVPYDIAPNRWRGLTFGKGRFIASSIDGDKRIAVFELNNIAGKNGGNDIGWRYAEPPAQKSWISIAFGGGVFAAVSDEGAAMASFDGMKWINISCPKGEWSSIIRTDYFFIAFSYGDNSENLNAMRSSSGGILGLNFASLDELVNGEITDKAVPPAVLKEYVKTLIPWKLADGGTERSDGLARGLAKSSEISGADLIFDGAKADNPDSILSIEKGAIKITPLGHNAGCVPILPLRQKDIESIDLSADNITLSAEASFDDIDSLAALSDKGIVKIQAGDIEKSLNLGKFARKDSVNLDSDDITGILPIDKGGTGASDMEQAKANLGLQNLAFKSAAELSGDDISGVLPLAKGGTGATDAGGARNNLGLAKVAASGSYNDLDDKPSIPSSIPLMPVNYSGWRHFYASETAVNAPAGGTWAYYAIQVWKADNTIGGQQAGVAPGGSLLLQAMTGTKYYGFMWKIQ